MTSLHSADITRRLNDYLGRRQPPKSFASDERKKADQLIAYVRILARFAPQGDKLESWWEKLTSTLAETSETWAWPTEGDFVKACKIIAKDIPRGAADAFQVDPLAVAEKRIENDEPIGDNWLWGQNALLLISRVGVEPILARRDRFAAHAAQVYGKEAARLMILDMEYRHREAISASESKRVQSFTELPDVPIKSVRDLIGPGPQYVPPMLGAAE